MDGHLVQIYYRVGAEMFVFRYRPEFYREALREVGHRASEKSAFTWRDAAIVTAAMRAERDGREAYLAACAQ